MQKALIVLCYLVVSASVCAQEFRGAWISTVFNKDWPSRAGLSTSEQKAELIRILERHKQNGLNAVIFQVRTASDAFYASSIEPWSQWLSGTQGEAPEPFYDPLQFAIDEAHKRGLELHAWLNPYRAEINKKRKASHPSHVSQRHPEWCIEYGIRNYLDPGLPEVRAYITRVVKDIITRYDVDGIHFDDYFYPYKRKGEAFGDHNSFKVYGGGFGQLADWRRDNVNKVVKMLSDTIFAYRPNIKFGISPFGIWRNKRDDARGSDTRGMTNYDGLYADVRLWLERGWVDYVMPQLYWPIGHSAADFKVLIDWWGNNAYQRHLYVGLGLYNAGTKAKIKQWRDPSEIKKQLLLTRQNKNVQGVCFFTSSSFFVDEFGINKLLQNELFAQAATTPAMLWKQPAVVAADIPQKIVTTVADTATSTIDLSKPTLAKLEPPASFRISRSKNQLLFAWDYTKQTDSTVFKIYRFRGKQAGEIQEGELYAVTRNTSLLIKRKPRVWFRKKYTFFVVVSEGTRSSTASKTAHTKLKKDEAGPLTNPSILIN